MRRGEERWGEERWGEVRWGEVRWGEVRWGEVRWGEVSAVWQELTARLVIMGQNIFFFFFFDSNEVIKPTGGRCRWWSNIVYGTLFYLSSRPLLFFLSLSSPPLALLTLYYHLSFSSIITSRSHLSIVPSIHYSLPPLQDHHAPSSTTSATYSNIVVSIVNGAFTLVLHVSCLLLFSFFLLFFLLLHLHLNLNITFWI